MQPFDTEIASLYQGTVNFSQIVACYPTSFWYYKVSKMRFVMIRLLKRNRLTAYSTLTCMVRAQNRAERKI